MSRSHQEDNLAGIRSDIVERLRREHGAPESQAFRMASDIIGLIRQRFMGGQIYVAKPKPYDAQKVAADFRGNNHDEVCRRHGISRRTLYRVLERQRAERRQCS